MEKIILYLLFGLCLWGCLWGWMIIFWSYDIYKGAKKLTKEAQELIGGAEELCILSKDLLNKLEEMSKYREILNEEKNR